MPDHVSRPARPASADPETGPESTPQDTPRKGPARAADAAPGGPKTSPEQGPNTPAGAGKGPGKGLGKGPNKNPGKGAGLSVVQGAPAESPADAPAESEAAAPRPKQKKPTPEQDVEAPRRKPAGRDANLPARTDGNKVPAKRRKAKVPDRVADADAEMTPKRPVPPPALAARPRTRHRAILLTFLLFVVLPVGVAAWYLWNRAEDRYASELGFTVRQEEAPSAVDFLGGLSNMSTSGASDTEVLYKFIQSPELVQSIDAELDLRGHYSQHFDTDPVFSYDPSGTIEDLTDYWRRTVRISYDPGTGLIELQVLAFDPQMAQDIGNRILAESSRVINELNAVAREDAMRYAREELELAQDDLRTAREELTAFRSTTRIVDPGADLQGQMGLLTTLQQQLAQALIELDMLNSTSTANDPRRTQAELRIDVIQRRIDEERAKFSADGDADGEGQDYASLVAEFERLTVEREFAEQAYTSALSAYSGARAEAERQSRYLAPYVRPTLAERSQYPQRVIVLALVAAFALLAWAVLVLIYYSLRDRQ
ncbi:hypothetical protein [Psychromarinibacter halotolerans]|uniref:Capsular polysaccharide transport system permease protein n=1 Tax=Psychromarinibacter halotolerans TaxID=1775175 RepID=A0ABV7GHX0_9RHOB|nr:hypothetical protein [Psychromarinibacter halotolerans]MDF0598904.1 hypothetical protein [Psychromarinibacter halotolerans]